MISRLKIGLAIVVAAVGFGAITFYALEGNEVVLLRTRASDGAVKATRTWIADEDGASFVEAAHAERPFYLHLLANPELEVVRAGTVRTYHAMAVPNPRGHAHIRQLLAAKYGWADWWVGLLQDTSRSIEVRLEPAAAPADGR